MERFSMKVCTTAKLAVVVTEQSVDVASWSAVYGMQLDRG